METRADPPTEAQLRLDQAYAYEERGELESALRECESAIQLAPDWAEAHNLRGIVLDELSRKEEAIAAYREALYLDPTFSQARENLYELQAELGGEKKESLEARATLPTVEGKKFSVRAGAYVIDIIAELVLTQGAALIGGFSLGVLLTIVGKTLRFDDQTLRTLDCISGFALPVMYFTIFEWLFGATLGKLILGMRVVQEDGSSCAFQAALVRGLLRYVDGILFGLVAYSSMKKTLLRQRLGDRAAKTIVVGRQDAIVKQSRAGWWFIMAAALYFAVVMMVVTLELLITLR